MANGQSTGFDVNAARKAGYSDDEILAHLTSSRKFDVDTAVKSGYSKADIIDYLSKPPAATGPTPDDDEAKRLVESGAGPAAATMQPGRTAAAVAGMASVGSLGAPADALVTAVATKSIRPLLPYIVGYFGSKYGHGIGKDIGGVLGGLIDERPAGEAIGGTIGAVGGGLGGAALGAKGKIPFLSPRGLLYSLLKGGPEGAAPEAAEAATASEATGAKAATTAAAPKGGPTLQSYSRDLLVQMARKGDVDALRELVRNPGSINVEEAVPNSRYLLGQVPKPPIGGPIIIPEGEGTPAPKVGGATIGEQLTAKHRFSNSAKTRQLIIDLTNKLKD